MLRRLPAGVLNVMITAAAKNKKVKTVIWMRIVQKTEVVLRVHPRYDQAGAAQVILPISMKLGQFEGVRPKLLHSKFKEIWSKPGGVDHPPCFFLKK